MAFLRLSDEARALLTAERPRLNMATYRRVAERSFRIALARGANGNPLHRTGDRIELADVQAALAEVERPSY